jgi:hypothetical protein
MDYAGCRSAGFKGGGARNKNVVPPFLATLPADQLAFLTLQMLLTSTLKEQYVNWQRCACIFFGLCRRTY